ncbi:MAG: Ig-like domain-containing protein [Alteromonadaceae bacterium]|nr:Ig-like domain-containing protein [Alteromonadaceae bacterium]
MKLVKNLAIISAMFASTVVSAYQLTLKDINPVVISSSPVAGTTTVDPSTNEITVKFSSNMMTNKMWSVVKLNNGNFPQVTGDVYFKDDARTFVIPVKLQADTVYAFSINAKNKKGFKGVNGKSAQPYIISFKTASKL